MSEDKSFEVQVRQEDDWTIHADFPGQQGDEALEEAALQLEQLNSYDAVRVIVEKYDPDTGIYNDQVIFKRNKEPQFIVTKAKVRRLPRGRGKSQAGGKPSAGAKAGKKKPATLGQVLGKLLLVVLFSLALAGLLSFGASELLAGKKIFGARIHGQAQTNLVASTFVLVFIFTALGLLFKVMRNVQLETSSRNPLALILVAFWIRASKRAAAEQSAVKGAAEHAAIKKAQAKAKAAYEASAAAERAAAEGAPEPSEETIKDAEEEAEKEEEEEVPEEEAEPQDPDALSPTEEKLKVYIMNFLTQSLEGSQVDQANLDNFNKFGLSIYMAGACEILTQQGKMDPASCAKILAESVQFLGFKKSHAASFAEKYEEYLLADSRYMQMFQTGRNAINTFLTDENAGPKLMDSAIAKWNEPKPTEQQSGPVTVLFTDIAGSTAMTQALGDEGAQKVVRVHNRIVREALSDNAGKEVKHTGDGIMASFDKTTDGVQASIDMQRGTQMHNQQNPEVPLHLKIGLNAGEPIAEDNDLFGTVVQLAARTVDKASADQIFVSATVRGLCAGKEFTFDSQGGFEMKGFSDEIVLYEVMWNGTGAGEETAGASPDFVPNQAAGAQAPEAAPTQPAPAQAPEAAPAQPAPDAGAPEKNTP